MKAIILAGGRGTRLEPEVTDIPKPMANVASRPFLEWQIDFLTEYEVSDIILSVGYKDGVIRDHFGDGTDFGVDIQYVEESEPLGTGGAVENAKEHLADEHDFLVLNGDTYLDVDLSDFLAFHRKKPGIATLALSRVKKRQKGGFISLNGQAQIEKFVEEERESGLVNGGIRVFDPELFLHMPEKTKFNLSAVCEELAGENKMYGYQTDGYFKDIGTPERYHEINEEIEGVVQ